MNIDFKNKQTIGLIVASVVLFTIVAALIAIFIFFPAKQIEVPDFANKTKTDVEAWITENDLSVEQISFAYEFNETMAKDTVLSQSILATEKLKKDDVLTITLSNGSDPDLIVTLPDFTGQNHDEIDAWFKENNFTDVTYEYIPDQKIKKDLFIKTNITEKEVRRSTAILVSISVGTESVGVEITMPDFKDYTKANIQAWAKTNNMSITFKEEASETITSGKVISQSPKAGEKTKTGSKGTVTLSTGKGATAIKFDGKAKKDVDAWAKENNIKITYTETYDNKVASGVVISNSPNSGTIKSGATMTVKISVGKPNVDNYTNKSKASFETYIDGLNKKSANLKISAKEVESTSTPGTIIKQTINNKVVTAATTVDTGTTIYIEVAKVKSVNVDKKVGSSFDDFKKYVEGLGMKVGAKTDRYNDTYNSNIIVDNDIGSKQVGSSINYTLSLGKYTPIGKDFDGISKDAAQGKINTANNLGAGANITFKAESFHESVASGLTYSCSVTGKSVTCEVSKGTTPKPITVESKTNSSEADFISYIKGLKLVPNKTGAEYSDTVAKGNIIRNATGNQFYEGNTIDYIISNGVDPANEKATFPNYSLSTLNGTSLEASKTNVRNALGRFTNIDFIEEKVSPEDSRPNFMVLSISIAPGTPDVLISTKVEVKILVKE